jgi:hypothetical protein
LGTGDDVGAGEDVIASDGVGPGVALGGVAVEAPPPPSVRSEEEPQEKKTIMARIITPKSSSRGLCFNVGTVRR